MNIGGHGPGHSEIRDNAENKRKAAVEKAKKDAENQLNNDTEVINSFFKKINKTEYEYGIIYFKLSSNFEYINNIQDPHITSSLYIKFILNPDNTEINIYNFYKFMDSCITNEFQVFSRSSSLLTCKDKNCVSFINSLVKIYSDNIKNELLYKVFNDEIEKIYTDKIAIIEDYNTNPFDPDPNLTIIDNYHEFIKTKITEFEKKSNTNDEKLGNNQLKNKPRFSFNFQNWFRKITK